MAADYWILLIKEEIEEFEYVPVLTLGEPVLNCLIKRPDWVLIRYSWGYEGPAKAWLSQVYEGIRQFIVIRFEVSNELLYSHSISK